MVITSIENVFHLVRDFNAVVGVHKHPVNEKIGQFASQTFGVENRSRGFLSVVVPRLFFLLLLGVGSIATSCVPTSVIPSFISGSHKRSYKAEAAITKTINTAKA
jgi:hypothetical protein